MKILLVSILVSVLAYCIYRCFKSAKVTDYYYQRFNELYKESRNQPGKTQLERLKALYCSRGRVLKRLGDILPKENRERFINDRIILAREIARLDKDDAEIESDFEIIQQPYIQY